MHGGSALEVGVLRGNLPGRGELLDVLFGGVEFSFAVRKGDIVEIADLGVSQPGGELGSDSGGGVAGDVAADVVVGECRCAGLGVTDFAVGNESGFDEGLKAIADAENEAVAVLEKVHHSVGHDGAPENGGDEFA